MQIVYDEPKRLKVLEERGLDMAALTGQFFDDAIVASAKNGRFRATGVFGEALVTAIFKPLGREAISLVTLRPASRAERRLR